MLLALLMTIGHFATAGNDSTGDGSSGNPYQTTAKANAVQASFTGLSFNGGDVFNDATLSLTVSGTLGSPYVVNSYGTGKATLSPPAISGKYHQSVLLSNVSYVTVDSLTLSGPGVTSGPYNAFDMGGGVTSSVSGGVEITLTGSTVVAGIRVTNCDISGHYYGVKPYIPQAATGTLSAYVGNNTIHGNAYAGIYNLHTMSYDQKFAGSVVELNDIYNNYGASDASIDAQGDRSTSGGTVHIPSGWGVFFGNGDSACVLRSNRVHNNGESSNPNAGGGPVGIMLTSCNGTTVGGPSWVYGNEVYTQHAPELVDGQGIDCDGGCVNCVVERNYVHDNDGSGLMDLSLGGSFGTNDLNAFRFNVLQNNGRAATGHGAEITVSGSTNSAWYNNTVWNQKVGGSVTGLIQVTNNGGPAFRNNVLSVGGGATFGTILGTPATVMQNNLYDVRSGSSFSLVVTGVGTYTSLSGMQGGGLEKNGGANVGSTAAPLFVNGGNGGSGYAVGTVNVSVVAYNPGAGSPLLTLGIDWGSALQGTTEWHGNAAKSGSNYPTGAVGPAASGMVGPVCAF